MINHESIPQQARFSVFEGENTHFVANLPISIDVKGTSKHFSVHPENTNALSITTTKLLAIMCTSLVDFVITGTVY